MGRSRKESSESSSCSSYETDYDSSRERKNEKKRKKLKKMKKKIRKEQKRVTKEWVEIQHEQDLLKQHELFLTKKEKELEMKSSRLREEERNQAQTKKELDLSLEKVKAKQTLLVKDRQLEKDICELVKETMSSLKENILLTSKVKSLEKERNVLREENQALNRSLAMQEKVILTQRKNLQQVKRVFEPNWFETEEDSTLKLLFEVDDMSEDLEKSNIDDEVKEELSQIQVNGDRVTEKSSPSSERWNEYMTKDDKILHLENRLKYMACWCEQEWSRREKVRTGRYDHEIQSLQERHSKSIGYLLHECQTYVQNQQGCVDPAWRSPKPFKRTKSPPKTSQFLQADTICCNYDQCEPLLSDVHSEEAEVSFTKLSTFNGSEVQVDSSSIEISRCTYPISINDSGYQSSSEEEDVDDVSSDQKCDSTGCPQTEVSHQDDFASLTLPMHTQDECQDNTTSQVLRHIKDEVTQEPENNIGSPVVQDYLSMHRYASVPRIIHSFYVNSHKRFARFPFIQLCAPWVAHPQNVVRLWSENSLPTRLSSDWEGKSGGDHF